MLRRVIGGISAFDLFAEGGNAQRLLERMNAKESADLYIVSEGM